MSESPISTNDIDEHVTISVLSKEIQGVMANRPSGIVRHGTGLFLLIFVLIVSITFWISYPDIITCRATIGSVNAPKEVKAKKDGKLVKLMVSEGTRVSKGGILGYIESTADHSQMIQFSKLIDSIQILMKENKTELGIQYFLAFYAHANNLPPFAGEIESDVSTFIQSFNSFQQYLFSGFYIQKEKMLRADAVYLQKLKDNLLNQKSLQEEDLGISQKNLEANGLLNEDKVISPLDYRIERSKYINKAMTIPQINSLIISNESLQNDKMKEIAQLENEVSQQKNIFIADLNVLKSKLDDWKLKYLLTAPIDGEVAYISFLQENQDVLLNQTICFINPATTQYYAETTIPQNNFGKVKIGQKVILKLASFPYQEFGIVEGEIDFISKIPTDSGYHANVKLTNKLFTNYNKSLEFHQGLTAQGEIITSDTKLSDKIFNEFRALISRD